ncbi:MAG: hypothetical protein MZU95_06760 [Desulfomicrobium escambiense]|nr:hypothetical protein [Desulfomicrobium escambiense]
MKPRRLSSSARVERGVTRIFSSTRAGSGGGGATTGPDGRGRHRRAAGGKRALAEEDEAGGRAEDDRDGRRDAGPVQLGSVHPLGIFTKG